MNTRRRFPFATWTLFTLAAAPLPLRAELFSWGYNVVGELGDATTVQRNEPVAVVANGALAGKTVTAIAAGESFSLALTADGKLFAWGSNGDGQIGDGTGPSAEGKLTPVAVLTDGGLGGKTIVAIAAGSSHSLALTSDGELFAWGGNGNGQRGDGTRGGGSPFPGPVNAYGALAGRRIVAIAAARAHSLALTADGQVFAWGDNDSGQLGDGTETDRTSPAQVIMTGALAGKTVTAIAAGQVHSFALTSDGKLFAWGANGRGNLGDGTTTNRHSPVAVRMDGPLGDKIIASVFTASGGDPGREHSLALTSDGLLLAWGDNSYGQLGDGTTTTRLQPVVVNTGGALTGKKIIAAHAGFARSMVITDGGQVFGWGYNANGQLGDGTTTVRSVPVAVNSSGVLAGKAVTALASSTNHCLALAGGPADIAIEQPAGVDLPDGAASVNFGTVLTGASGSRSFTVRNKGAEALTGLGITFVGAASADFSVTTSPSAPLAFGAATTFTVRFAPTSAGTKTAALHVASNDADENPFDITLTGTALAPGADADGDGVTNAAEVNLATLGFDPLTDNTALRTLLHNNAAGMGLYRAADIGTLALGEPVLERNAGTGNFVLRIGIEQSAGLTGWTALPGTVDFTITPAGPAPQFFRVLGRKP